MASPVVAIGVGVALGTTLRNIPISIVDLAFTPDRDPIDCGAEAAVDCAASAAPVVIVEVMRFGFAVLVVALLLALVGAAGTAAGWYRLGRASPTATGHRGGSSPRADHVALGLLVCGIALMIPALCLAASFVASVAS